LRRVPRYHREVPKRILVVEDDEALRGLYRTTFALAGYAVEEASDGLVALNAIDNSPPDLVVLDLMLPTVSGFVVQQDIAARTRTRSIPVIIVTGSDDKMIDQLGVACVLRKPVSPDHVLDTVRACLHEAET
jgi:two-component system, OmpR family, phosphate regulon response regulator PhoB